MPKRQRASSPAAAAATGRAEENRTTGPKLWVVLARAYGALASFVEASVAEEGLCLSDFMVLEVLLHKGPMTISTVGAKVLLANASMTAAVDRLEQRRFVTRRSVPGDGRVRMVELTPLGSTFISALYQRHAAQIEDVFSVLTDRQRMQMRSSLKKLGLAAQLASEELRPDRIAGAGPARPKKKATNSKG